MSKALLPKYEYTDNIRHGFSNFISNTKNKLFILAIGSCVIASKDGYYTAVLKYNDKVSVLNNQVITNSANVCILTGIMAAIDKIKKPTDVYIVVSTPLGFATKNSPNRVLCLQVQQALLEKNCHAELIELTGQGTELSDYICKISNLQ